MKLSRIVPVVLVAFVAMAYIGFRVWETSWYKGMVPAAIAIKSTVLIDGQSGIREGCGVAIFKLSDSTLARIRSSGLAAVAEAHEAREHPGAYYFTFGEWQETPYVSTGDGLTRKDRWLSGLGCADMDEGLRQNIDKATRSRGSFYATREEAGLIVIPALGLVVLSYEG
jgi:hypothetical protein